MPDTFIRVEDITENLCSLKDGLDEQMITLKAALLRLKECKEELKSTQEYHDNLVSTLDEVKDDIQELQSVQPIVSSFKELSDALKEYFGPFHEALNNETDFRKQIAIRGIFQNLNYIQGEIDV